MRRALATAGLFSVVTLGSLGMATAPALAEGPQSMATGIVLADADPVEADGNDDTGKWGLAGLTGLVGLFGYKKYRDHRTANRNAGPAGTARP